MNRKQLQGLSKTKLINLIIRMQSMMTVNSSICIFCSHSDSSISENPCLSCLDKGDRHGFEPLWQLMENQKNES